MRHLRLLKLFQNCVPCKSTGSTLEDKIIWAPCCRCDDENLCVSTPGRDRILVISCQEKGTATFHKKRKFSKFEPADFFLKPQILVTRVEPPKPHAVDRSCIHVPVFALLWVAASNLLSLSGRIARISENGLSEPRPLTATKKRAKLRAKAFVELQCVVERPNLCWSACFLGREDD